MSCNHETIFLEMKSNYEKQPYVTVPSGAGACVTGWTTVVTDQLSKAYSRTRIDAALF